MHFIKSVKSTSRIVRLKDDREEKQTDDGRLFHVLLHYALHRIPLRTPSPSRSVTYTGNGNNLRFSTEIVV